MRNPLSKKVVEIQPSGIRKFFDIVSEMPDAISLGVGEPDFDTPWRIREEGIYTLEKGKTFYTSNSGLKDLKIEIEVRNFDELNQVLAIGGVDRIMLDNFTPENTRKAVEIIGGRYETESSGGITFDTLRDYAECGVDFISVGALTHSVKGLDMSFKAC